MIQQEFKERYHRVKQCYFSTNFFEINRINVDTFVFIVLFRDVPKEVRFHCRIVDVHLPARPDP